LGAVASLRGVGEGRIDNMGYDEGGIDQFNVDMIHLPYKEVK